MIAEMITELEAMALMLAQSIEKVKALEAELEKWKHEAQNNLIRADLATAKWDEAVAESGGASEGKSPLTHAVKAAVAVTAPDHLAAKFLRSCGWMNNGQVWTKPTHQQYVAVGMAARSELERALQAFKGILG